MRNIFVTKKRRVDNFFQIDLQKSKKLRIFVAS